MSDMSNIGAPGDGQGAPEGNAFDFERAYGQLQPEYTRSRQELSEYRERLSEFEQVFSDLHDSDPEIQRAAMDYLGLELDTGSPESGHADEFVDPLEEELHQLRGEVDNLRSARELEASERQVQELSEMRNDYIGEAIGFIEQSLNREFTAQEEQVLGNLAIAMEDEEGVPNVQAAYQLLYENVLESERARWIASKTGAAQPPAGTSIPADQKPTTKAERIAYLDERVRALNDQQ